ncbi:MAG: hypothetical protein M1546_14575 [Chloroflexi bacterium]|nr:hypothetical protein [Chloroflexota bacterium]
MQYFKPPTPYFVGDCMPFFSKGTYHLYYLQDENHHQGLNGLGGHQWAHATSTDLIHWQHHSLALAIDTDWEKSICTGSVFYYDGVYNAYYATRLAGWQERLCVATSTDGIHFTKAQTNPFMNPPQGYRPNHFRDPFVFRDESDGLFHMLVTASLTAADAHGRGGCLAHLVSGDLQQWKIREPFMIPGYAGVPECPDYFSWNGLYYLIFSIDGVAHYRISQQPLGPWECPRVDTFDGPMARVMKTAAFTGNRRIGVAFLASLKDDRDDGDWLYAGNAVFRELVQHSDGSLGTRFVLEMTPAGDVLSGNLTPLTPGARVDTGSLCLHARQSFEEALLTGLPANTRLSMRISPQTPTACYGIAVRGNDVYRQRYEIALCPAEHKVDLRTPTSGPFDERGGHTLRAVDGLDRPLALEIIMTGDIIDICMDGRRCLVNRLPELHGDRLYLFCHNGQVTFSDIHIQHL